MKTNLFLLLLLWPELLIAVQGDVELSIQQDAPFWVGQKIVARLSVKTDAYNMTDLRVDTQSGNEVIIIKPQSAAYRFSEEINDIQWQSTVYEYVIYPMQAGEITLKPFKVMFSASMGYGQPKHSFNLHTPPLNLHIGKPEGVSDNSFVLTTTKLQLDVTYTPAFSHGQDSLTVGDAFERKITISAENVPDFLLQPIPGYAATGSVEQTPFKVYRSEPVLSETRSSATSATVIARRIETDTFVANVASSALIPEIVMYWWEPQQRQLHQARIPAKYLNIIPDPLVNSQYPAEKPDTILSFFKSKKTIFWLLLPALAIIISIRWWLPIARQRRAAEKRRFDASEAGCFKRFEKACNEANVLTIYQTFYTWARLAMVDVSPLNFQQIGRQYPALKSSLEALESALNNDQLPFDSGLFRDQATTIRQTILMQQGRSDYDLLESINPIF